MGLGTTYGPRRDSRLARTSSQLQVLSLVIVFWKAAKQTRVWQVSIQFCPEKSLSIAGVLLDFSCLLFPELEGVFLW